MKEQGTIEIDIQTLLYGGDALGRLPDGRAVFLPGALPGERVRARLLEDKPRFARAQLLEVLRPSPDRIAPPCSAADCGGCHYAHLAYPAQLLAKQAILRDQFQRIAGLENPPVAETVASPQQWNYRNAAQFHLTPQGQLGFQAAGSHVVTPLAQCCLCEAAINEVLPALDFAGVETIERVQVRAGIDGDILLILEGSDPVPPEFTVDLPISAVFVGPGGFAENAPLVLAGDDHLVISALERLFRVSAGAFFQVNSAQAENVVRALLEHLPLEGQPEILEVYAGVGLFSAFLAPHARRLVAVEASPAAADDFIINLDAFDNVELYSGPAETILPALEMRPDLVLVDPPRAGLALPALDAILAAGAPALAYLSCDPATLARDTKRLAAGGYQLMQSQPFDMFPQTYHIESLNLFRKTRD